MAGGYPEAQGDSLGPILKRILDAEGRIRDLEKATGTQIAGTVAYLQSLITRGDSQNAVSTGDTPGDQTFRWFDTSPPTSVTLDVPTGRLMITAGCGEASLNAGNGSALAAVSFTITAPSGTIYPVGVRDARIFLVGMWMGVSLVVNEPADVPKDEPITVTAKYGIWSASTTTLASAQFNSPYVIAQVIDPL